MTKARPDPRQLFFLLAAAILIGFSIAWLPPSPALLKAPATPFDRIPVPVISQSYRLLWRVSSVLPAGSTVAIRSEPRDPGFETSLFRNGVALLNGRKVLPAALWGQPVPGIESQADFVIVVGPKPAFPPGTLVFESPDGSLWRRSRP
jgi:hypothetical protein